MCKLLKFLQFSFNSSCYIWWLASLSHCFKVFPLITLVFLISGYFKLLMSLSSWFTPSFILKTCVRSIPDHLCTGRFGFEQKLIYFQIARGLQAPDVLASIFFPRAIFTGYRDLSVDHARARSCFHVVLAYTHTNPQTRRPFFYHSITPINCGLQLQWKTCPRDGSISLAWPQLRIQSMTNERGLSLITWAVITVLADEITVTMHAWLLTTLAVQTDCQCYLCRWWNVICANDHCTFDPLCDFLYFYFDLMCEANGFGWFRGGLGGDKPTVNMKNENK